jgi:hypothetical protein
VFDRAAPLDEQGARPSLAFLEEERGDAGVRDVEETAVSSHGEDAGAVGGTGVLNALSFRHNSKVAAQKQRDSEHDAAIFGAQLFPGGVGKMSAGERQHINASLKQNIELLGMRGSQVGEYAASRLDDDEDGPVIVTEEELKQVSSWSDEITSVNSSRIGMDGKESSVLFLSQSDEIKKQQSTMSWRERAMQARLRKQ